MRAARAILLYAVAVILIGALAAPWSFWLVHSGWPNIPFGRVFDRALLVVALIGLWPLLRALEFKSWAEIGLVPAAKWWRHALTGFGIGLLSLASAGGLLVIFGMRRFDGSISSHLGDLVKFLLIGIVVGVLEEIFFRGGIFGALRRGTSLVSAVLISSAIYSALHFMKARNGKLDAGAVTWLTGFTHLGQVVNDSWQQPGAAIGFVTLLLAGCILALAFARTRALYLSIGIHAGWVLALKSFSLLTHPTNATAGGSSLLNQIVVWPVLLLTLILVACLCRKTIEPFNAA